jgi:hypothetical protein
MGLWVRSRLYIYINITHNHHHPFSGGLASLMPKSSAAMAAAAAAANAAADLQACRCVLFVFCLFIRSFIHACYRSNSFHLHNHHPTHTHQQQHSAAGAAVALASLRRSLGPSHVRLQPCWAAVQCLMVADTPQPLRTWALHSLAVLVKGMNLGAGQQQEEALQVRNMWGMQLSPVLCCAVDP